MKKMMFNDRYGLTEAVIQGRKTVTRRTIIAPNWACDVTIGYDGAPIASDGNECADRMRCERIKPPYKVGEIVAVAQSYETVGFDTHATFGDCCAIGSLAGWNNKMFVRADLMPYQIRILDVRAERLQDITDEDCLREGVCKATMGYYIKGLIANWEKESHTEHEDGRCYKLFPTPKEAFASLIDKISGRGTWATNPYVWRIEFELVGTNEK